MIKIKTSTRRATPQDGERISAIYNQGIKGRMATFETRLRTPKEQESWLEENQQRPAVVSIIDETIVGFAYAGEYRSRPCYKGVGEFSIYIDGKYRKLGIGKELLLSLIEEAEKLGYWKLVSRIFDFNDASRNLCKSCGFREVGIYQKHGKLDGSWIDCVIVEKLITENLD
ncbi:arsinothricin resistance N-acetyltransferase ArsN1 [Halobacillus salinarum]|uniref:Arsinothricin resistance N-acetyltransferase ArsN1 n=1 Tax=Halobacillus salinarum TaxID=2932257 RepID=A0ABY4EFK9_9BACI|nr:arsinothricin resistance N-acetyltransferase ArsN1 family A [Halobacillus salinarum]UOQ42919.1 arsinothricin resistance N-acetyltransferase ArsN1 [Halobacillus salinarum]